MQVTVASLPAHSYPKRLKSTISVRTCDLHLALVRHMKDCHISCERPMCLAFLLCSSSHSMICTMAILQPASAHLD